MALNLDIQQWRLRIALKVFFSASLTQGAFKVGIRQVSASAANFSGNIASGLTFATIDVNNHLSDRGKWLSLELFKTIDTSAFAAYDDSAVCPAIQAMTTANSGQYFLISDILLSDYYATGPGVPQKTAAAAYTLNHVDNGKHIYISTGGVTVPNNSSVALETEFCSTIINNSGSTQTIGKGGSVTLIKAGSGSVSSLTLAAYGVCTLLKVGSDTWIATGNVT